MDAGQWMFVVCLRSAIQLIRLSGAGAVILSVAEPSDAGSEGLPVCRSFCLEKHNEALTTSSDADITM